MVVRCEKCQTEFGFDGRQLGDSPVSVRCSVCKHVFEVDKNSRSKSWQVRTTDGATFKVPDIKTLGGWIDEGRMHPDDEVSRTGRKWVRLGDMPEFSGAFAAFDSLPSVAQAMTLAPPPPEAPAPAVSAGLDLDFSAEFELEPEPAPAPVPVPVQQLSTPPRTSRSAAPKDSDGPDSWGETGGALELDLDDGFAGGPGDPQGLQDPKDPQDPQEAPPKRRRVSPGLIALLGLATAVGLMFGVPSIREQLLNLGGEIVAGPAAGGGEAGTDQGSAELRAAQSATTSVGLSELAKAEAQLQLAVDAGPPEPDATVMKLALAELLLTRSLAYQLAAAASEEAEVGADYRERAKADRKRGAHFVDAIDSAPDGARLTKLRAFSRLAAGRDIAEVAPMVPTTNSEAALIVQAADLWRDPEAKVPEGLIAGLLGVESRSGLVEGVLALALARAGDDSGAQAAVERMLNLAPDSIIGVAMAGPGRDAGPDSQGEATGESGESDTGDESAGETGETDAGEIAKAPPAPGAEGGGGGGGGGFDSLVGRGCDKVSAGQADEGLKLLRRAFDIRPKDIDVLVCMANAYAAQGNNGRANQFYDRALEQSPKNRMALSGAANAAAKVGAKQRAISLYERLLEADPHNGKATVYLAKHKPGGGDGDGSGSSEEPAPTPAPAPQPEPSPETPEPAEGG